MKNSLLKKLLLFILPISIIPLILMVSFNYLYLQKIIINEVLEKELKTLTNLGEHISLKKNKTIDLHKQIKDSHIRENQLILLDRDMKSTQKDLLKKNQIADFKSLKKRMLQRVQNANYKPFHDEKNKLFILPILSNNHVTSYIALIYKEMITEKLFVLSQTFIYIFFIIIFILFITTILIIIFSLKLLEPLNQLISGIKKATDGNFSYKIKHVSDDEIGVLVNAFNDMSARRKFIEGELKELNQHLEDKVEEKTSELRALNQSLEDKIALATQEIEGQSLTLIKQSRLAQMGEMISMIAHQWRQPLGAITAIVGTLSFKIGLKEYEEKLFLERLQNITDLSVHLSTTIDDFRNFYKPDKEMQSITIDDLINRTCNIIGAAVESAGIKIIQEGQSTKHLHLYANEIVQVLLNIIKNAQDVFIERDIEGPYIKIIKTENSITICDNAGGVSTDIIDKIFDPYFSTKDELNGSGLGLYMSKSIINDHHKGDISVTNDSHGACFTIKLHSINME